MNTQTAFKYPDNPDCRLNFPKLIPAQFVQRDNRFRLTVKLDNGEYASAHLANPGRLRELLVPGKQIWLSAATNPNRKTSYDAQLLEMDGHLVSLNSQLPNRLIGKALHNNLFPEFNAYPTVKNEVQWGNSRFDFCLFNADKRCWVEVKSVTLIENGYAAFPDAPTLRGRKHLLELIETIHQGDNAAVIFVVQRADAQSFTPHDSTDPDFGGALRQAHKAGVQILAVKCAVSTEHITITHRIPVHLGPIK